MDFVIGRISFLFLMLVICLMPLMGAMNIDSEDNDLYKQGSFADNAVREEAQVITREEFTDALSEYTQTYGHSKWYFEDSAETNYAIDQSINYDSISEDAKKSMKDSVNSDDGSEGTSGVNGDGASFGASDGSGKGSGGSGSGSGGDGNGANNDDTKEGFGGEVPPIMNLGRSALVQQQIIEDNSK